MKLEATMVMEK